MGRKKKGSNTEHKWIIEQECRKTLVTITYTSRNLIVQVKMKRQIFVLHRRGYLRMSIRIAPTRTCQTHPIVNAMVNLRKGVLRGHVPLSLQPERGVDVKRGWAG